MTPASPQQTPVVIHSDRQIYQNFKLGGTSPLFAVTFTAISLRESGGNPNVVNRNSQTGDRSYGYTQINMLDPSVRKFVYEKILLIPFVADTPNLVAEMRLCDPLTNVLAALALFNNKWSALLQGWYIDKGEYRTKYESFLPRAQWAAIQVELGVKP